MKLNPDRARGISNGVFLALFVLCYAGVFSTLVGQWTSNTMYSYGCAIPFISGYLVWRRSDELLATQQAADYVVGIPLTAAGLAMLVLGHLGAIAVVQEISLIVTMILAATGHARMAGALFNDVGPVIETAGLDRIRGYVGRAGAWPTWVHAARALGEANAAVYPRYVLTDWLAMAKRLCRVTSAGRIVADYDSQIAAPFRMPGGEAGIDMWPALDALANVPTLIVRGALSDLFSDATATEMVRRIKSAEYVAIPDAGHAPTLDEPEAIVAIDALLARIAP